jgi:hypothetical protein
MAKLDHAAIAAAMGAKLGPRIAVHHGQIGSAGLVATIREVMQEHKAAPKKRARPNRGMSRSWRKKKPN